MSGAFHRHRFVGDNNACRTRGFQRRNEFTVAKQLRRQRAPARFAWLGGNRMIRYIRALERVAHRRGEQRSACGNALLDQARNVIGADAGTRRVVHEHKLGIVYFTAQRAQTRKHGVGTFHAAFYRQHRLAIEFARIRPIRIVRRERNHQSGDAWMRCKAFQRVDQQWFAGDRQILLGNITTDACAASGCWHHAPQGVSGCHCLAWDSPASDRRPGRTPRPA